MQEDCIKRFISENVSVGQTALDIGANQGLYTTELADKVESIGKVHAFEDNPMMTEILVQNVPANNVFVHGLALSDHEGTRPFYIDTRKGVGAVASSLNVLTDLHEQKQVAGVSAQTTTVDLFCRREHVIPNFMKIDVEGHELEVFRGGVETINRYRPVLVFEFWETWWNKGVRRIFEFLANHYQLVRLQDGKEVEIFYYFHEREGVVDIGCLPLRQRCRRPMNLQFLF